MTVLFKTRPKATLELTNVTIRGDFVARLDDV